MVAMAVDGHHAVETGAKRKLFGLDQRVHRVGDFPHEGLQVKRRAFDRALVIEPRERE